MASRAEASERMKTMWEVCNLIALRINEVLRTEFTKNQVHDYLYAEIVAKGWLQQVKDGNRDVMAQLTDLPGWERMTGPRSRIHQPERRGGRERPTTPFAKLKLGMWFIDMIGDAEEAMAVIKAAAGAVKQLAREES